MDGADTRRQGDHGTRGLRLRTSVSAVTFAVVATLTSAVPAAAGPAPPPAAPAPADDGAHVVQVHRVDARTVDLFVASPALGHTAPVRLQLPPGWTPNAQRTWPSLYMLHGANDPTRYRSWTEYTDAEQFLANKDVLAVMPDDGMGGFYSNRWNYGHPGGPDWETFHLQEVRQILERNFHAGGRRAVVGGSLGGYGAMSYASRHPGMFQAAASYSGVLNTMRPGVPSFLGTILAVTGKDPGRLWGPYPLQRKQWQAHNPYENTQNLRGTHLYVSAGDGQNGALDPPGQRLTLLETMVLPTSRAFAARLRAQGIPVTTSFYGKGTHNWWYWQREFHRSWPVLAAGLGLPS